MWRQNFRVSLSIFVLIMAQFVFLGATPATAGNPVPAGVVLISNNTVPMDQQLAWVRGMPIVKFHIQNGSGFTPGIVRQLAANGTSWIIARTPDCVFPDPAATVEMVRPYVAEARDTGVKFTIELCNEPSLPGPGTQTPNYEASPAGWSAHAWTFRWYAQETARQLHHEYPGVTIACCGFFFGNHGADYMKIVLTETAQDFDFISIHTYGWTELQHVNDADHALELLPVAQTYHRPILITEAGINDVNLAHGIKATRFVDFLKQTEGIVAGVTFFAATSAHDWPGYEWDTSYSTALRSYNVVLDMQNSPLTVYNSATGTTTFIATGKTLQGGFQAFWGKYGGMDLFGYPITNEFNENGVTVQYFERARFEWYPGSNPQKYDVMLGRLGVETFGARYGNQTR